MNYVADTHGLVWFLTKDSKLGVEALRIFRSADRGNVFVVIPSIVIAEAIYISENKGVSVNFSDLVKKFEETANIYGL